MWAAVSPRRDPPSALSHASSHPMSRAGPWIVPPEVSRGLGGYGVEGDGLPKEGGLGDNRSANRLSGGLGGAREAIASFVGDLLQSERVAVASARCRRGASQDGLRMWHAPPRDPLLSTHRRPRIPQDDSTGDGSCTCDPGYTSPDCTAECPGFDPAASPGPCQGHGTCYWDGQTAFCRCDNSALAGHWGGADCSNCSGGWWGNNCDLWCYNGLTVADACVCLPGFAGGDCSLRCPRAHGVLCGGHGACRDGAAGDGTCACDAHWYRRDCTVRCDASECFPRGVYNPEPHAQCSPDGECECQLNATGWWAGPQCNRCAVGYYGTECDRSCACSGHGACGWLDGVCDCFASPDQGFWAGTDCSDCAPGYLAPACRARNVRVSRSTEVPGFIPRLQDPLSEVLVVDALHGVQYVGSHPVLLLRPDGLQVHACACAVCCPFLQQRQRQRDGDGHPVRPCEWGLHLWGRRPCFCFVFVPVGFHGD